MAINNEKFGFTVRDVTTGLPLSGALVELRKGATIYTLTEVDTSGYYVIDVIPTGKYSVYIDAADSGQTFGVGTGQIAALGNEADNTPLSTASEFEFKTPDALKITLELDQVNNVGVPVPTPSDENKVPIVDSNGDYVLGSPNTSGFVQTFEINTASDWQAALAAEFDEKIYLLNRDTLAYTGAQNLEVWGRGHVYGANIDFATSGVSLDWAIKSGAPAATEIRFFNSKTSFGMTGNEITFTNEVPVFIRTIELMAPRLLVVLV